MMSEQGVSQPRGKRPVLRILDGSSVALCPLPDRRSRITVECGRIDQAADDVAPAVFASGSPYYQRGDSLVRKVQGVEAAKQRPGSEAPLLVQGTQAMLLDDLERTCRFTSRSKNAETGAVRTRVVGCPKSLPSVILARAGRLPVPVVRGIAEVPLLHEDGSIVFDDYDPRSRVVVIAPGEWLPVPSHPTEGEARNALARIDAVIAGFPFAADIDRSVTVAALLSAVLRPTLPACPAFAWSAPVRGSGKSKLADVCSVIATGRTAPALTWPAKEDEAEKRLAASVMSGDAIILLDNIETPLRGACLNSLLTQPTVSLRVLGLSKMLRLGAAVLVLATGNNLVLLGDLSRRFLVAHLDPHTERPELRRFDFDPVARALIERRSLVAALHTIAVWGQGKLTGLPPLGSFETWSRRVRDPLVALGLPDCCAVLEELHKADPERETALEVLTEWRRAFGSEATTVAEAIRLATKRDGDSMLRDALDSVAGGPAGLNARRLGKYLQRNRDRVFGDMVLRRPAGKDLVSNVATWAVETPDKAPGFRVSGFDSIGDEIETQKWIGVETKPGKPGNPESAL